MKQGREVSMSIECRILVVEDDELLTDALREQFALHEEFEIMAQTAAAALIWLRKLSLTSSCWMSACPTKTGERLQNPAPAESLGSDHYVDGRGHRG